jgi:hypothetical protein
MPGGDPWHDVSLRQKEVEETQRKAAARLLECENVRPNGTIRGPIPHESKVRLLSATTGAKFPGNIQLQVQAPQIARQDDKTINLLSSLYRQEDRFCLANFTTI